MIKLDQPFWVAVGTTNNNLLRAQNGYIMSCDRDVVRKRVQMVLKHGDPFSGVKMIPEDIVIKKVVLKEVQWRSDSDQHAMV